jgi:hypothetical protein
MNRQKEQNNQNENTHFRSRKSQIEMIGLIIIVVIVIIAMLVYMVNKISHPVDNVKRAYVNNEIATNMLITMTKVNIQECPSHTLAELISDCAKEYHSIICGSLTSCEEVNKTLAFMINKTLDVFMMNYNLTIADAGISFVKGCPTNTQVRGFQILPLYPGQVEIDLAICN